ncbi:XRE family transcriptional regulator [Vibrio mediterranei]|uniref:XRE family transcriptional regulator n=1 Tax=Vibrio mediterranei TaxID=689 RepID=UPI002284A9BD|nr:XRE family transcriptional regulator [Vibrio mediterranei]MCY9855438.1 XRE family transcriptional regulator [Vibrio mediterranei]
MISTTYKEKPLMPINVGEGIIQKDLIIPFKDRLRSLIGDRSVREFSQSVGIPDRTLRDYLHGKTYPTLDRLCAISDGAGVDLAWLAIGRHEAEESPTEAKSKDNIIVPEYDIQASAGGGSFVGEEVKIGEFSFPETWLRQKKLYGCDLCVISAWGESMEPSIQHKDSLLISLLDKSEIAAYDGVYVLRLDGLLLVKRMQYDMENRGHHIISDNPIYRSTFIPNAEFDERVAVIGNVTGVVYKQMGQPDKEHNTASKQSSN